MSVRLIISAVFLVMGILLLFISAMGVLRLPDFISRLHASGIGETIGMMLVCVGSVIYLGMNLTSVKVIMILFALFLVNPVGTHLIAKAAHYSLSDKIGNVGREKDADITD
ncbi:MAG: monovalent cation/H(+) antiporter subunit G [Eubacteriaceae bacterium]|nr:monovalent cation/H(+) antiporter subunit G [Eubacteriaceae bacterium]